MEVLLRIWRMENSEELVRAKAVKLILDGRAEDAIKLLSDYYGISTPKIKIGLPKGHRSAYGCYVAGKKTIYLRSSREYRDPFIVLHEYYHHLRTYLGKHRGTEKHANRYALESIKLYIRYKELLDDDM